MDWCDDDRCMSHLSYGTVNKPIFQDFQWLGKALLKEIAFLDQEKFAYYSNIEWEPYDSFDDGEYDLLPEYYEEEVDEEQESDSFDDEPPVYSSKFVYM